MNTATESLNVKPQSMKPGDVITDSSSPRFFGTACVVQGGVAYVKGGYKLAVVDSLNGEESMIVLNDKNAYEIERAVSSDAVFDRLNCAQMQLVSQRKSIEAEMVRLAEQLKHRLDGVVASLDRKSSVNSLGELQSSATRFDQLCALRSQVVEHETALNFVANGGAK